MRKKIEKLLIILTALPLHALSYLWPKKSKLWLFGAWYGEQYSDNSKYLFEEVSDNFPGIESWWIAKNSTVINAVRQQGRKAVHAYSLQGLYLQLRARVYVCTVNSLDFLPSLITRRNYFVQLWHGTPLKAILFQTWSNNSFRYWVNRLRFALIDHYSMIVSPNEYTDKMFSEAFNAPNDLMFRAGYPRCDALHINNDIASTIRDRLGAESKKLWFYLPTHRLEGKQKESSNAEQAKYLIELSSELQAKNIVLVIKPHFYERKHFENIHGTSTVQIWLDLPDELYACLGAADGLLTDYSSIAFDFAVLNRPIIFYAYDESSYISNDRELQFLTSDLSKNTVYNISDLMNLLFKEGARSGSGLKSGFSQIYSTPQSKYIADEICSRLNINGTH